MNKLPKIDWPKIRAEYLAGTTTKVLAERHGIRIATLRNRISRGKWVEERVELGRKRVERIHDQIADREASQILKIKDAERQRFIKWLALLEQTIESKLAAKNGLNLDELKEIVSIEKVIQDVQYKSFDVPNKIAVNGNIQIIPAKGSESW